MLENLFNRNRRSIKDMMKDFDGFFESMNFDSFMEDVETNKETYTSPDGMFKYTIITTVGGPKQKSTKENDAIVQLKKEMDEYVEKQEFEKAAEVRDKIKKFEKNRDELEKIQLQLDEAVSKQDFESAIKLRDKLNKLKS
jgi:excinuclease UvrABC helicase subunit UvrB